MNQISEVRSNKDTKWRRSYKACLNCRLRKIKCDMGPLDKPHEPPCKRCKREGKTCEFLQSRKKSVFKRQHRTNDLELQDEAEKHVVITHGVDVGGPSDRIERHSQNKIDGKWRFEISSMQNALEFLAKAAGSVAKEDNQFHEIKQIDPSQVSRDDSSWKDLTPTSFEASRAGIMVPLVADEGSSKKAVPLIKKLSSVRPKPCIKLSNLEFIGGPDQLTEEEVIKLVDVFFLTMYPFFPHIPLQLQDPEELARYPLLLCSIVTVSARYHSFSDIGLKDNIQNNRNIEVHEQLWIYCQKLISQTIWAEASTRSIGTVLAFLLFTEWNPRAIHWKWSDYANSGDSKDRSNDFSISRDSERLTGMAAIRRSDRMAWMLTGNAVRLAQDMGFNETSSKIFTATHISETHTAMNVGQRSTLTESLNEINLGSIKFPRNNSVGNEQFYLEKILENDDSKDRWTRFLHDIRDDYAHHDEGPLTDIEREFLNDEYVLYYTAEGDSKHRDSSNLLPFPLRFSKIQKAKIELLRIITVGFEAIYCTKDKQQSLFNDPTRNLALLHLISPLIESWYKSYHDLLEPAEGKPCTVDLCQNKREVYYVVRKIDRESLICEYYYCQLYIYSSALQVDVKEGQLKLHEITRSAKYVELAYNAAKMLLTSATRLHKLNLLKCMPVRWVTRIVKSVAFIVKCYLTLMGNAVVNNPLANTILKLTVIPAEDILKTIHTAALILKEASPDELHLCMRYSTILMSLCSEMRESEDYTTDSPTPGTTFGQDNDPSLIQPLDTAIPLPNDVVDWFSTSDEIGLEFVESWAEMIEQRYLQGSSYSQNLGNAADTPT